MNDGANVLESPKGVLALTPDDVGAWTHSLRARMGRGSEPQVAVAFRAAGVMAQR